MLRMKFLTWLRKKQYYPIYHPLADKIERVGRRIRERLFGVDLRVFNKTIAYYREALGETVTPQQALERALDKKRHKAAWYDQERDGVDSIMHFYQEVDVYPFRQPYLKRLGAYRWLMRLVGHIKHPAVLEYGCGSAVLTEYLCERFPKASFTVADIPSRTLEFVRWKKKAYQYPYTILEVGCGREGIPLRDSYDLIICTDVLEHTPNPLEIVESFVEHLSPRGVLVVDFLKTNPGGKGENLGQAQEQRDAVKKLLREKLMVLKAIDEPCGNNGLYMKPDR
jgi:2-polyprenyl-3-methyl-5-hydroxy-6-metoxy-1,4-benzoquinol methylase